MRSSKAPALATWMLEHLVPGRNRTALAGDLVEQFNQGRTAGWYWRQVFAAILLGIAKEQRIFWIAAGVTLGWSRLVPHFLRGVSASAVFGSLVVPLVRFRWPWSLVYDVACLAILNVVPIMAALALFFLLTRSFGVGRFFRGLSVGLGAADLFFVLGLAVMPVAYHPHITMRIIGSLPLFFTLVLSMCATRFTRASASHTKALA